MKKLNLIIFVSLVIFVSCKKENKKNIDNPSSASSTASQAFTILTSTKWRQTHDYYDTTNYAASHLNQWPLPSTTSYYMDSCAQYMKAWFKPNNDLYSVKGLHCPANDPDTAYVGTWYLLNNDTRFLVETNDTLTVLELTNNSFKLWYKTTMTDVNGNFLYNEYKMWVFEPTQ